jgi:hypothetical protein
MEGGIMRRRLYFLLPDLASARQTANDLLLARIEDRHMHFLAHRGTPLGELREASHLQKTDAVHGAKLGMVIGGIGGLVLGVFILLTPGDGFRLEIGTLLVSTIAGALFGAWASLLVGLAVPNTRLKRFQDDIEAGKILLMVDVPPTRVEEIQALVHRRHPEAADHGMEPTVPAFP